MYVSNRASPLGDTQTPATNGNATLAHLPSGRAGTIATLKHMKAFVDESIRAPTQRIRKKAAEIFRVKGVPPRAWAREISALHSFVRDEIRYLKDPIGVELVQSPEATLDIGQGDCDDKATLLAALLKCTGHPSKFTVVGMNGGDFSHVLVQARVDDRWVPLETIIQKPMGWFPPGVTTQYSMKV